jgi:dolichol-phosphate mannosyltransferase
VPEAPTPKLSLIVPTYNEKESLKALLERLRVACVGIDYEVVVVDDSSPDGTWEVAEKAAASSGTVVLVKRPSKMGLATAFIDGLQRSRGKVIGMMDADLQHPPELVPRLLAEIDSGADISVASRYVEGGSVGEWSLYRRLVSRGARWLGSALLPQTRGVKDTMSGFFMLRREVLEGVNLSPTSFKVLLEILAKGRHGKVVEVPYTFEPRRLGRSKLGSGEMLDYLSHLFRLMIDTGAYRTFVKFCIVGLSGVLVNEGVFWVLTVPIGVHYLPAGAVSWELAVLNNFTWNDRWTFRGARGRARAGGIATRLSRFNASMAGGLVISLATLTVLTSLLGLNPLVSNLFAIAFSTVWNFLASSLLVWARPPRSPEGSGGS